MASSSSHSATRKEDATIPDAGEGSSNGGAPPTDDEKEAIDSRSIYVGNVRQTHHLLHADTALLDQS